MSTIANRLTICAFCLFALMANGQPEVIQLTYNEGSGSLTMNCEKQCAFNPKDAKNSKFYTFFGAELCNNFNGRSYTEENLGAGYDHIVGWFFFGPCVVKIPCKSFSNDDSLKLVSTDLRIASCNRDGIPNSVGEKEEIKINVKILHKPSSTPGENPETTSLNTDESEPSRNTVQWVVIVGVVVILLFVISRFVYFKWKPKNCKGLSSSKQEDLGLVVVVEEEQAYEEGLADVRKDLDHYFLVDLEKDFSDTAVKKIYFHHTVIKKMYGYFKHFLESPDQTNETGCYFVGRWEYANDTKTEYNISLEEIVEPGDDIIPGEFSFNFGKKIGVKLSVLIDNLREQTHQDYVHTVWMHSHPGLGLFLSSHDLLVQQQLAYQEDKNRLVAIVIDTNTPNWEMAIFSAKHSGGMNNKDTLTKTYSLDDLYQWSRNAAKNPSMPCDETETTAPSSAINVDNYHVVQIHHQSGSGFGNLFFSGASINALDDILYKCHENEGVCGHFSGYEDDNKSFVIENCISDSQEKSIGILIVNNTLSYKEILHHYGKDVPANGFAMIYRSDEELWICFREVDGDFTDEQELTFCSLKPMKEWTRRRRIYK